LIKYNINDLKSPTCKHKLLIDVSSRKNIMEREREREREREISLTVNVNSEEEEETKPSNSDLAPTNDLAPIR
jgi:hypothetical protein